MRILIYVFLGIFSIHTLQISAQVRIGGLKDPHSSAVLDLNEIDTINDGVLGLALPRVKLSSDADRLDRTTPPNGMMVYNTGTSLEQGVYYYSNNKWIKVADGSFFEGDAIVGNEVTDATPKGGLKRDGAGAAGDPYTLGIAKNGVESEMIAENAVTGDKIASAPDKSVLQHDGSTWAPASMADILKGSSIKHIYHREGTYKSGGKMVIFPATVPEKTIYLLNGYYYDGVAGSKGYAPLYITGRTSTSITLPTTSSSSSVSGNDAARYNVFIVEFE